MPRYIRILFLTLALISFFTPSAQTSAQISRQAADLNLDRCKLIRTLGQYCTWPEESFAATGGQFIITILGEEPDPRSTDAIFKRLAPRIKDRKLVILRARSVQDVPHCQILYLTNSIDIKTARSAIQLLNTRSVLLVGESPQFAELGGCTALERDQKGLIHLKVNVAEVRSRKIGMDARLSKLAVTVETIETSQIAE